MDFLISCVSCKANLSAIDINAAKVTMAVLFS